MINIENYKKKALEALSPIKPADGVNDFLYSAERSKASKLLPDYFLIFFLFSDLLNFKNLGQFEKLAWSFPINYKGKTFHIEHRKFGVGVFIQNKEDETSAEEIAKKISRAVNDIRPFYDHIAEQAILKSEFNVINNNRPLFDRFDFLIKLYKSEYENHLQSKRKIEENHLAETSSFIPLNINHKQQANWLAISCIEAFYSWTEHLFIHLAIISQNISDGERISKLIGEEWKTKYKAAIPLDSSNEANCFYNDLVTIRRQLRNFVAHGAFGKNGNAFNFHSKAGAVPVLMNHKKKKNKFSLHGYLTFKENEVINLIENFIKFLWAGNTAPAMEYTMKYQLPTILTLAMDGSYSAACESMDSMKSFADNIMMQFDNAANMDW